jgi:hypothetical protein
MEGRCIVYMEAPSWLPRSNKARVKVQTVTFFYTREMDKYRFESEMWSKIHRENVEKLVILLPHMHDKPI